jgi:hypothetical protein
MTGFADSQQSDPFASVRLVSHALADKMIDVEANLKLRSAAGAFPPPSEFPECPMKQSINMLNILANFQQSKFGMALFSSLLTPPKKAGKQAAHQLRFTVASTNMVGERLTNGIMSKSDLWFCPSNIRPLPSCLRLTISVRHPCNGPQL